jgi:hypothetical protein
MRIADEAPVATMRHGPTNDADAAHGRAPDARLSRPGFLGRALNALIGLSPEQHRQIEQLQHEPDFPSKMAQLEHRRNQLDEFGTGLAGGQL